MIYQKKEREVTKMKELTYTVEREVIVDVAEVAKSLAYYLSDVWDELGFEYEEREAIDETEVLKAIAKHWLKTL